MATQPYSGFHNSSGMITQNWIQHDSFMNLSLNSLNITTEQTVSGQFQYGPNPHHPAYIFGERVLRPTIDMGYNLGHHIFTLLKGGYAPLDSRP